MFAVRKARASDLNTLTKFQLAMALETERLELDSGTVAKGVAAVLEDSARGHYLLASIDQTVVGCLLVLNEWSDWRNGTVLWIHSVYVEPAYRKRGVFESLFGNLKQSVQSSPELLGLRLYVDRHNLTAKAAYQALGMSDEHYELFEWMKSPQAL